jgi:OFA family oxalate/formate antiporter-like MFS transporter
MRETHDALPARWHNLPRGATKKNMRESETAMSANAKTISSNEVGSGAVQSRWVQLVLGIICMALVANLQYGWTAFVDPINTKYNWGREAIQIAFTIFVAVETWLVPVEGWLVDKFGPRPVIAGGGILAGLGWVLNSYADNLTSLYIAAVVSGLGAGAVYGTCVGNALKWFPDRRGLAAGLTAAGFGAGSAFTLIPITNMISTQGYEHTFFTFGLIQGGVILVLSMFLVRPNPKGVVAVPRLVTTTFDYSVWQMLKTPVFWITYVLFIAAAAGGVMLTAQVAPIAKDYGFAKMPISVLGLWTMPLLTVTLFIDNIANGFTRPLCGFISDRIGRENTMLLMFVGQGLALLCLMWFGRSPTAFLIFAPLVFLCWGEIYSLFPSLCADTFGAKNAAANAGALYTAKGTATIMVPIASALSVGGNWDRVMLLGACMAIGAGIVSKLLLAPVRHKTIMDRNARTAA